MTRTIKYLLPVLLLLGTTSLLPAQIDSVIKMFVDRAAQSRPTQAPRRNQQPRQQSTTKRVSHKFDGTWLATDNKNNSDAQQVISRAFTLVIKEGKAVKTLDTSNASAPEKPFYGNIYELHRKWTYNSVDLNEQGTSLTIQWSPGQLADWTPKTIPNARRSAGGERPASLGREPHAQRLGHRPQPLVFVHGPNRVSPRRLFFLRDRPHQGDVMRVLLPRRETGRVVAEGREENGEEGGDAALARPAAADGPHLSRGLAREKVNT